MRWGSSFVSSVHRGEEFVLPRAHQTCAKAQKRRELNWMDCRMFQWCLLSVILKKMPTDKLWSISGGIVRLRHTCTKTVDVLCSALQTAFWMVASSQTPIGTSLEPSQYQNLWEPLATYTTTIPMTVFRTKFVTIFEVGERILWCFSKLLYPKAPAWFLPMTYWTDRIWYHQLCCTAPSDGAY